MSSLEISDIGKIIKPFLVMEVLDKAKHLEEQGRDIIHLEIGEPDFKTADSVCQAAISAIEDGYTGYTHSLGLSSLREAISKHYQKEYGVKVNPQNIIVSSGTSPLILLSLATIIQPGDEVILTDPTYACYPNFIRFLKGECRFVKLDPESGFAFDVTLVKKVINNKTKAIMINSPSNPTGLVIPSPDLQALASLDIPVISDEIYHGLVYKDRAHSLLEFSNKGVVINGFSKLYAMPGWRIGFAICDEQRIRAMQKMQQNFFISASNFGQRAALVALEKANTYLPKMIETYNKRRKLLLERLPEIGFGIKKESTGAFYILADARRFCTSSYDFALEVLEKTGVALTPGIDFGENAEGFVRFTYANSYERIEEALDRLADFLT